jgi:hypothetical protein
MSRIGHVCLDLARLLIGGVLLLLSLLALVLINLLLKLVIGGESMVKTSSQGLETHSLEAIDQIKRQTLELLDRLEQEHAEQMLRVLGK